MRQSERLSLEMVNQAADVTAKSSTTHAASGRAKQAAAGLAFGKKEVTIQTHSERYVQADVGDVFLVDGTNVNQGRVVLVAPEVCVREYNPKRLEVEAREVRILGGLQTRVHTRWDAT